LLVLKSFLEGFKDEHESTKETPLPKNQPSCINKNSIFNDIDNL